MLRRIQAFSPQNETEQALLCAIWKIDNPVLIPLGNIKKSSAATVADLQSVIASKQTEDIRTMLHGLNIGLFRMDERHFCVDFQRKVIFCLEDEGFDISQFRTARFRDTFSEIQRQKPAPQLMPLHNSTIHSLLGQHIAPFGRNAEWEVGAYDGEIDNERKMKR